MKATCLCVAAVFLVCLAGPACPQTYNDNPPDHVVKLIFIHHSTGENWLADGYGNLGIELGANNYFVSDTNYGWGPNNIGDRTDIPDWVEWFSSADTPTYMNALFNESSQNCSYSRTLSDPGGENEIVMFKSCFPNSALEGNPDDPPDPDGWLTVGHAKWVYNEILQYFQAHPEKLFVVITAPPLSDPTYAANARAFNNWLYYDWLASYTQTNVAVFDFYNVLTHANAHHRYVSATDQIEHVAIPGANTLYYPSGDDHPNAAGSQKATAEYVPLLNIFYNRWNPPGYSIDPTSVTVPKEGGTGDVSVTACSGCSWTSTVNDSWLHCTAGCSGTDSGTLSYSVDANSGNPPRTGTITIAGRTFTVHQNGLCWYCDYFDDDILSPDWNYLKGDWWESDGFLQGWNTRKAIAVASPAFDGCDNCTVSASMRTDGGYANKISLLGWYQDKWNSIELMMKEEKDKWILKQRVDRTVVRKAKAVAPIEPGVDYDVRIVFDGSDFQVLVDEVLLMTMPAAAGSAPYGTVGFQSKGTTGSFGFVEVN
jgi:hypothetical protein